MKSALKTVLVPALMLTASVSAFSKTVVLSELEVNGTDTTKARYVYNTNGTVDSVIYTSKYYKSVELYRYDPKNDTILTELIFKDPKVNVEMFHEYYTYDSENRMILDSVIQDDVNNPSYNSYMIRFSYESGKMITTTDIYDRTGKRIGGSVGTETLDNNNTVIHKEEKLLNGTSVYDYVLSDHGGSLKPDTIYNTMNINGFPPSKSFETFTYDSEGKQIQKYSFVPATGGGGEQHIYTTYTYGDISTTAVASSKPSSNVRSSAVVLGNQVVLNLVSSEIGSIRGGIYSISGRKMADLSGTVQMGMNRISVDSGNFGAGVYMAQVQIGNQVESVRFTIK